VNFVFAGIAELNTKPAFTFQLPFIFSGVVVVAPVSSLYSALRVIELMVFEYPANTFIPRCASVLALGSL
jgi:hypothetical protein